MEENGRHCIVCCLRIAPYAPTNRDKTMHEHCVPKAEEIGIARVMFNIQFPIKGFKHGSYSYRYMKGGLQDDRRGSGKPH